jgi:NAD(P)-dependent dehydrogenase (short-subunit alcohol dehydrogenase family)
MKKNILLFGANSFIAKEFVAQFSGIYDIYPVSRRKDTAGFYFDFEDAKGLEALVSKIPFKPDAILFLQGINPSVSADAMTEEHFLRMLKVNLVTPSLIVSALKEKMATNCMVLFISSVAKKKGSYDPAYATAKSGLTGLMLSLAKAYPGQRFNIISLGLVEGSPVYEGMTEDFRAAHAARMQNGEFIKAGNVCSMIDMLIRNENLNMTDIAIDGGYQ